MLELYNFLKDTDKNNSNIFILNSSIESGNISHAYLFYGSNIEFLTTISLKFAASINCKEKGCGKCIICQKTLNKNFESLFFVRPKGALNSIQLKAVKEIQEFIILTPKSDFFKICIIREADLFSRDAANKFLKTLEEPPDSKSVFILLTENIDGVLKTIKSRCINFNWDLKENLKGDLNKELEDKTKFELKDDLKNDLSVDLKGYTLIETSQINDASYKLYIIIDKAFKEIFKFKQESSLESSNLINMLGLSNNILRFLKENEPIQSKDDLRVIIDYKNAGATNQELKKIEKELTDNFKKEVKRYYTVGLNSVFDIITAWLDDIISVSLGVSKEFLNYSSNYDFIKENLLNINVKSLLGLIEEIEKKRENLNYSVNNELLLDSVFLSLQKLS